jgi:hypothetical protein
VGYTFKKDVEEQKINLVKVLNESLQVEMPHQNAGLLSSSSASQQSSDTNGGIS